jgi:sugar phosphate isomerase/epimerase
LRDEAKVSAVNPLAIDPLSTFGMPPVDLVHLSADLGCEQVGMTMFSRGLWDPPLFPPFSLRDDPQLPAAIGAALRERGLTISFLDGFLIEPGKDIRERRTDLEIMAELGAPLVNTVSVDPDLDRTIDQFGVLVDLAAAAGMDTTLELVPAQSTIGTLAAALAAIEAVGRREFRLLVDTMHYGRAGARAADVAALDPHLIGYVQINDVKLVPDDPDYFQESIKERLVPGTGELDNLEMLAAVPPEVTIGIEVPRWSAARRGAGPHERLGACVTATRALLANAGRA